MQRKRAYDWFISENGRKCAYFFAGGTTMIASLAHFLPNTIFLDKYRDLIRLYSNGLSVPIPEKVLNRFADTLKLLQIPLIDRPNFKPFMACGFDIFSIGSAYSRFGVRIGLPVSFTYDNVDSIDKFRIKVNQESVVWESDAGKQLLNSFILSENAQKYAMAREIELRRRPKLYIDICVTALACFSTYVLSSSINRKFNFYDKPRVLRVTLYGLISLLAFGQYIMIKDLSQVYYEQKIDEDLKQKSLVFAQGGKEFYSKILERNIALRQLMGKEGPPIYTALGNENYLLRNKHIPLVHRKQFFEDKVVEYPNSPEGELTIS